MTLLTRKLASATAILMALSATAQADVTMRYLASHGGISSYELAHELGYFEGTSVTLENVGYATGGPETLIGLAGGSLDIASPATAAGLNAIAGGNDFVMALPSNGINDVNKSYFYVLEDSPIQKISDLAGKTIAINTLGAHLDYTVQEALLQNGLAKDAANLITVPGPQLEQVLRSGQVDVSAFGYWQATFEGAAREAGGLRAVFDDTDVLGDIAGGFVVLSRDFIRKHPAETKVFVDNSIKALEYARLHPQETQKLIASMLQERGENPEIAKFFKGFGTREGGKIELNDLQFWIDVLEREGLVDQGVLIAEDLIYDPAAPQTIN